MQFLTTTFPTWGIVAPDRPPDASPDPNNAWDAIDYSAANYRCGGADQIDDLHAAVLRYKRSDRYYQDVLAKATARLRRRPPDRQSCRHRNPAKLRSPSPSPSSVCPPSGGGATPCPGFDCSGLVPWSYTQIGIKVPRTRDGQVVVAPQTGDVAKVRPPETRQCSGGSPHRHLAPRTADTASGREIVSSDSGAMVDADGHGASDARRLTVLQVPQGPRTPT